MRIFAPGTRLLRSSEVALDTALIVPRPATPGEEHAEDEAAEVGEILDFLCDLRLCRSSISAPEPLAPSFVAARRGLLANAD